MGGTPDHAIINGADLSKACDLTQEQLITVVGDEETKLPDDLILLQTTASLGHD